MTILEAIGRLDALRHNTFSQEEKIKWLEQVETLVYQDLVCTHENADSSASDEFQTSLERRLLVPHPYDEMYLHYMEAQMDYHLGEFDRYNRSMGMYQAVFSAFANYYNRTHLPKGQKFQYF